MRLANHQEVLDSAIANAGTTPPSGAELFVSACSRRRADAQRWAPVRAAEPGIPSAQSLTGSSARNAEQSPACAPRRTVGRVRTSSGPPRPAAGRAQPALETHAVPPRSRRAEHDHDHEGHDHDHDHDHDQTRSHVTKVMIKVRHRATGLTAGSADPLEDGSLPRATTSRARRPLLTRTRRALVRVTRRGYFASSKSRKCGFALPAAPRAIPTRRAKRGE